MHKKVKDAETFARIYNKLGTTEAVNIVYNYGY